MKSFKEYIFEGDIVKREPQTIHVSGINSNHPEVHEVVQGVYEEIDTPENVPVHEHLSNHSDAEGLVRGIMRKMGSSDQELIEKHHLHTEEGVKGIVQRLKNPNYSSAIAQQFKNNYGRKDGSP